MKTAAPKNTDRPIKKRPVPITVEVHLIGDRRYLARRVGEIRGRMWGNPALLTAVGPEIGSQETDSNQPGRGPHDEHAGRARLTPEDVETVRGMRQSGETWEAIARRFGVASATVRDAGAGDCGSLGEASEP